MDITGIGDVAKAASNIFGMIFPNKTEEEKNQLAAAFALIQAQTDINKAEAQSPDPLQHWRGGLGWVCVLGYLYNFVLQPVFVDLCNAAHHPIPIHPLDIEPLVTLTIGMLGLGGLHAYQTVKGKS